MSSNSIAIRVQNLSKCYQIYNRPQDRLKQSLMPRLRRWVGQTPATYYQEFWALKDVSLEVPRGKTIGIIGRNGSGKSSLLQVVAGTLTPTSGNIYVYGRVAALLELGAGFNPEFTGRENVFMNAAILGLGQAEIEQRYDSIVEFAAIGDFINQPIKTYSSGMYARLAFAVAVNVDPDILVVDEVLSVGDEAFQRKCFGRIEKIKEKGGTILFVSHSAGTIIDLCDQTILMDAGERILTGLPKTVVSVYQRLLYASPERATETRNRIVEMDQAGRAMQIDSDINTLSVGNDATPAMEADEQAEFDEALRPHTTIEYLSKGVTIRDVHICDGNGRRVNVLIPGHTYRYCYLADFQKTCAMVRFGMLIKTTTGTEIAGQASHADGDGIDVVEKGNSIEVRFEFQNKLLPGIYFGNAGVLANDEDGHTFMHRLLDAVMFRVKPVTTLGVIPTAMVDLRPSNSSGVTLNVLATH
jgi:lipopolysaccharide transport system ATP-binding protein